MKSELVYISIIVEEVTNKSYKFRLLPTEEQRVLIEKHFGCVRFVYNHFLAERQKAHTAEKRNLHNSMCSKMLTSLKQENEWLQEVTGMSLVCSLANLDTAYTKFFKKKAMFPKFKKKGQGDSFYTYQCIHLRPDNHIQLAKFGKKGIRFIQHRDIKGKIVNVTVSKSATGKYYASICCELPKEAALPKTGKSIGIDLGIKDFAISSDGQRFTNPKFQKQYAKKLKQKQKALSRKTKGSNRRQKAKLDVAKVFEKITNSRQDMQHKVSSRLVKDYDLIALENLNVKGMVKNKHLSAAVSDAAWSSFVSKLKYKAEWAGKEVVVIDRFYPSTKTCHVCDHINEELTLKDRQWTCPKCETKHDRDVNAAKNILRQALTLKSSGTDDYRRGAGVRPKVVSKATKGTSIEASKKKSHKALKPEASA